jgi:hypothetical protein
MEENKNRNTDLGQQSNQDWDDTNDQRASGSRQPNPERFQDANLGQGSGSLSEQEEWSTGSERPESDRSSENQERSSAGDTAFTERHQSTSGAGSSQRSSHGNVGPLDSDLNDLPSQRRSGNQSGSGLG